MWEKPKSGNKTVFAYTKNRLFSNLLIIKAGILKVGYLWVHLTKI